MTDRKAMNPGGKGRASDQHATSTLRLELDRSKDGGRLELELNEAGMVRSTQRNAVTMLREHSRWSGVIAYDLRAEAAIFRESPPAYAGRDEVFPRGVTDADVTASVVWMSLYTNGTDFPEAKVRKAIDLVARENAFDPVAEELLRLEWDGKFRLDAWPVTYLGVRPSAYALAVGGKFLISAVARALQPGCKVDHVLLLEGEQGIGKTTALSILGGKYHRADLPPLDSRDVKEALRGFWIVEFGEAERMTRGELASAKNFLTLTNDTYRVPYGSRSETRPRRLVFAGTTNQTEYLSDQTGNRRFWPLACTVIDLIGLARDRDQLLAEAVVRFKQGDVWHLSTPEEVQAARLEQEKRRESDPWEERIVNYANTHRDFKATEVLSHLGLAPCQQGQREKNRLSRILHALGYRLDQARVGDARVRVYRRISKAGRVPESRVSPVDPPDPTAAPSEGEVHTPRRDTRDDGAEDSEDS